MAQKKIDIYSRFQPTAANPNAANKFRVMAGIAEGVQGLAIDYARTEQSKQGAIEGQKAGEEAAKSGGELETKGDFRFYDQAYNQAALTAYKTSVTRDAKLKMQELMQEHQNEPDKFNASMQGYLSGLRQNSNPEVMAEISPIISEFEYQAKSKYSALQYGRERDQVGATLFSQQEGLVDDTLNAARKGDLDALEISRAQLDQVIIDRHKAGYITGIEKEKALESVREQVFVNTELGKGYKVLDRDIDPAEKISELDKQIDRLKKKKSKDLDAKQNQTLVDSIESMKNQVIAQATRQRSMRNEALTAKANLLKDRITRTKKALDEGIELDRDTVGQIIKQGNEINQEAGKELIDLTDLGYELKKAEKVNIFSKQPMRVQESLIAKLEAKQAEGLTPEEADEYSSAKRAHEKVKRLAQKDAIMLYTQQGFAEMQPLNFTDEDGNFDSSALTEGLAARKEIASMASQHYNVSASPITEQEAQGITSILQELDYQQQGAFIGAAVEGLGDESVNVFEQISRNGGSVLAWAGSVSANGGDSTHILRGQQLRKENKLLTPTSNDFERYAMTKLEGAYSNPAAQAAAINAAKNAYASLAYNAGDFDQALDDDLANEALRMATGGIVEYNDKKIPAPIYGMTSDDFENFIEDFRPHYFDMFGTDTLAPGITKERLAEMISDTEVDLVDRGYGKYLIKRGDNYIMNDKGEPYKLNIRAIIQ